MSIKKAKPIGKFVNPETGRANAVFVGTDTANRRPVKFIYVDGRVKRISPNDFRRWKRAPGIH